MCEMFLHLTKIQKMTENLCYPLTTIIKALGIFYMNRIQNINSFEKLKHTISCHTFKERYIRERVENEFIKIVHNHFHKGCPSRLVNCSLDET